MTFPYLADDLHDSLDGVGAVGLGEVLQRQALVQRVVRLDVVAKVETVCKE